MYSRIESVLSLTALLLSAAACHGSSPPSNTPAAAGSQPVLNETASSPSMTDTSAPHPTAGPIDPEATRAARASAESTQSDTATSNSATSNSAGNDTAAGDTAGSAQPTTPLSDAQIAAITDGVNSSEIEQAKLAQSRTKNPEVRRFATMMIQHHGEAKKKQAALKLDSAESPLSQQLTQEANTTLESLKAKKGAAFDQAYLQAQVDGHQKVLDTLQRDLRPQAHDPGLQSYLSELEPKVSQHLEQARSAEASLQTRETEGSGTTSSR